ncbi:MAG: M20/M25/M40 family metallo-hydrolase [Gemmatimonadaceae bacterium]|nr:M20/M25/M40 family metallo-hydrolase [Gemmatimonadaceae bacterium]
MSTTKLPRYLCAAAITTFAVAISAAAQTPVNADATIGLKRDPTIVAALRDISADSIRVTDTFLAGLGSRHTLGDTLSSTRGPGAARRYLFAKLNKYSQACGGCLRVAYQAELVKIREHPDTPTVNMVNVVAWLPGRDTGRVIVMGGHYDTCACNRTDANGKPIPFSRYDTATNSPGADDDGSGTSAVVELARVFSKHFPKGLDATVIFALYSGEEENLYGSRQFAKWLHDRQYRVAAAFTDDMVGNVQSGNGTIDSTTVRVYGADPENGQSRDLARYAWAMGKLYTPRFTVLPVFRLDRVSRGGDHSPFVALGDPGLRFSEKLENYTRQHLPADVLQWVNFGYVANVARLNAAVVASIAAAPPPPQNFFGRRQSATGGNDWELTWTAAPGAVGYEVLYKSTFAPTWEKVIPAGNVRKFTLPFQLDDGMAGLRSIGANGSRSIAVAVPPVCPPNLPLSATTPVRTDSASPGATAAIDVLAPSTLRTACVRAPGQ